MTNWTNLEKDYPSTTSYQNSPTFLNKKSNLEHIYSDLPTTKSTVTISFTPKLYYEIDGKV